MEGEHEIQAEENVVAPESRPSAGVGFAAIPRILFAPRSVYEDVRNGVPFWPALLVYLLLTVIVSIFSAPFVAEAFYAMIQSGEMELPMPEVQEMSLEDFKSVAIYFIVGLSFIQAILAPLLSTLFYWLATIISFGSTGFGRMFTMKVYAGFIGLILMFSTLIYFQLTTPEFSNLEELAASGLDLSPALLLGDSSGFLVRFLRTLHVFAIWQLLIFSGGVAYLIGRRGGQTIWPIGIVFLLGALLAAVTG